jgi:hypothetical protein
VWEYAVKSPHGAFSLPVEEGYSTYKDYDPCGNLFFHDNCPQHWRESHKIRRSGGGQM